MTIATTNEKIERQRALGRAKYHRWAGHQPDERAHAQGADQVEGALRDLKSKLRARRWRASRTRRQLLTRRNRFSAKLPPRATGKVRRRLRLVARLAEEIEEKLLFERG